ncbi:hypothetical protein Hanom_Chr04g00336811 [Helianthus anomalus]
MNGTRNFSILTMSSRVGSKLEILLVVDTLCRRLDGRVDSSILPTQNFCIISLVSSLCPASSKSPVASLSAIIKV